MNNIVLRLRAAGGVYDEPNLYDEAADHINQLEAELAQWKNGSAHVNGRLLERIAQLEAALRHIAQPGRIDRRSIAEYAIRSTSETKGNQG